MCGTSGSPNRAPGDEYGSRAPLRLVSVRIREEVLSEICSLHSKYGKEVAGLAVGVEVSGVILVEDIVIGENLAESADTFYLDPVAIVEAYRYAELIAGFDVVALIHTHPRGVQPSYADLKGMELWPLTWIIVDVGSCSARAWLRDEEKVKEVPVELV